MVFEGSFYFFLLAIPAAIPAGHKGGPEGVNPLLRSNPKSGSFPEAVTAVRILLLIWIFPERMIEGSYWC